MLKILRYLKDSKWAVLLLLVLLVVQAYCDLALPSYTADIVDVGIQNGGIAEIAPDIMRPDTLENLGLFMTDDELQFVREHYAPDADGNLVRQKCDRQTLDTLNSTLTIPLTMLAGRDGVGQAAEAEDGGNQAGSNQAGTMTDFAEQIDMAAVMRLIESGELDAEALTAMRSGGVTDWSVMRTLVEGGALSKEAVYDLRDATAAMAEQLGESMLEQRALLAVKNEYEALDRDMNALQTNYLLVTGAKMLGVTLVTVLAAILASLISSRTAAKVGMTLRGRVFQRVVSFSNGDMDKFSTASLITRSTNDIQQVQTMVVMLRMVVYAPILGIGGVIKVLATRTGMGWIIVVAVAALLAIVGVLMLAALPRFNKMPKLIDRVNLVAREILTGLPVIRAFSREQFENNRFDGANTNLMNNQLFVTRTMALMMPLMTLIMNGITIMIVWFGAKGIDMGNLRVGDMMAFITYAMQIVMSFLMLAMMATMMLPRAIISAGRIDEVLSKEPSIANRERVLDDTKSTWDGVVAFDDVSFRYPDAEADVLEHITFTAKAGETTAILGGTGSGKSTLLNLVPRFFDVTGGHVTIDGIDIRDLSQHTLRSLIGYVPQKGVLFSGDIASNLKFSGDDISDADMELAAEIAQAKGFIEEKPEGFHDPIAQGGTNVSGGQRQRLSIARAVAKKPPVLLFDDSFSALDYKTDVALRRALNEKVHGTTVIIVAQRISTVLHADQIVVLEDGKMVGIGTHEQLMESCKAYQEIARSQLSEEELKGGKGA